MKQHKCFLLFESKQCKHFAIPVWHGLLFVSTNGTGESVHFVPHTIIPFLQELTKEDLAEDGEEGKGALS